MNTKVKQWVGLTLVAALAIGAAGWFLVISPKRSHATQINEAADAKDRANAMLVTQLATLKAQAKNLPAQQAAFAAVAAKIPDNPQLPALIRALDKAADDANVELVSIAPSSATPLAPPAAATTSVTPTGATKVSPAAAASSAAGTLNALPVLVSAVGGYFQVEQFLDSLENLTRAFKVTNLVLAPGDNPTKPIPAANSAAAVTGKSILATINGNVYLATGRTTTAPAATTVGK